MQIFMDFRNFANFCLVSCKVLKAVKIEFDTRYLSWGSSPKLALGSLRLIGIETRPAGSTPSTPPIATTAPCRGVSHQCDAAMLGMYRCVGAAFLVCCRSALAAHLAAG